MAKLYWINVDAHTERRVHMECHLNDHGYLNQRVEALTPKRLPSNPGSRSELEYACLFSHFEALRLAGRESNADWALVSEDDIHICGLFDVSEIARSAPADAEILQLTSINAGIYEPWISGKVNHQKLWVPWKTHHSGTQFYAVKLVSILDKLRQVSVAMSLELEEHNSVKLNRYNFVHVADEYIYQLFRTYTSKIPFAFGDYKFGSYVNRDDEKFHRWSWPVVESFAKSSIVTEIH